MYKSLEINNFKQFIDFKLEGLSRVNIIAGKNNTGKTTILEAIFLLFDRGSPIAPIRSSIWRGLKNHDGTPDSIWRHLFPYYSPKEKISIRMGFQSLVLRETLYAMPSVVSNNQDSHVIATSGSIPSLEMTYYNKKEEVGNVFVSAKEGRSNGIELYIRTLLPAPNIVFFSKISNHSHEEDARSFSQLDLINYTEKLIPYLKIIVPKLKALSLGIHNNTTIVQAELTTAKRKIPLALLGDGVVKLLNILLSIAMAKDGITLIDEIENGFHFSIMTKVWKVINEVSKDFNTQVFATTHSYEMLKSLINDDGSILEGINYVRLDKTADNVIKAVNYPIDILKSSLTSDWEIR